jgi:hypothetical protein
VNCPTKQFILRNQIEILEKKCSKRAKTLGGGHSSLIHTKEGKKHEKREKEELFI